MFLKHLPSGDLVEVINLPDMANPHSITIRARSYEGEVIQRPKDFLKSELVFPSGELLPHCWVDGHYQEHAAA